MFRIKPTTAATVIAKNLKLDNVPINVVIVIMTCSQVLEQQVIGEHELMKVKATND
jgi:hypothetical protein